MAEDKIVAEVDKNTIEQSHKFLNALLDDYNACKTELAKSGIFKAFRILHDQVAKEHADLAIKFNELKKELDDAKAKIPKTKEDITKILHEAGFHELEECADGVWTGTVPSPDLTPAEYGVLYRRLYGELTKADLKKIDHEIRNLEKEKESDEAVEISEKAIELCKPPIASTASESTKLNNEEEEKPLEKATKTLKKARKSRKANSKNVL